jgi:hypothetical protein
VQGMLTVWSFLDLNSLPKMNHFLRSMKCRQLFSLSVLTLKFESGAQILMTFSVSVPYEMKANTEMLNGLFPKTTKSKPGV